MDTTDTAAVQSGMDDEEAHLTAAALLKAARISEAPAVVAFLARTAVRTAEEGRSAPEQAAPAPAATSGGTRPTAELLAVLERRARSAFEAGISDMAVSNATVCWKLLICQTALLRSDDGTMRNLTLVNVAVTQVPREFWELGQPAFGQVLFGLRPGTGCRFDNVTFISEEAQGLPTLSTRV